MKFEMGMLTTTKEVSLILDEDFIMSLFLRHSKGDWGDLTEEDIMANEQALESEGRLFSKYSAVIFEDVYVITEADRSSTTMMFVSEY